MKSSLVGLILALGLLLPQEAIAQTISLSIWPPLLTAMVKPGKSITQVYRIKNAADATTVKVSVVPFTAADEQGHITPQPDAPAPDWFSLLNADLPDLPLTLDLEAGQTQELVLKISVPEGADEFDYPVALMIESDTKSLIGGSGAQTKATLASPILLTVSESGQPHRVAQIVEFSTGKIIDSFEPIKFILRVKNQSLNALMPVGQIEIKNTFGRMAKTLAIEPDNILGGSVRQLRPKINPEPDGAGLAAESDLIWNPALPLGRYTATVKLTPEDTTNTVSAQISFWVLPYKALLSLAILWVCLKALRK